MKHCLTVQLRQTGELCLLRVRKDLSPGAIQHMQGHLARRGDRHSAAAELIQNGPGWILGAKSWTASV